ncbi:MAG: DUF1475 family protein [Asgard group archaeon]|nr:DUF1475 family protein [Asgard group archaeon]
MTKHGMVIGKILSVLGMIGMATALLYGFIWGDFLGDGNILLSIPWGIITLIDIYISFAVFCGFIIYRESHILLTLGWIILVIVLGSFTICTYLFIAFHTSKGDWSIFWHGKKPIEEDPSS